ncbi:MAG: ABC-type dipeptide transport system, periplasmic component, partial [Candidatus Woesebacteria bacterium GW2011_GWC1_38_13]
STQSETNITKYKNLRIDKILEDGRVEQDKEKRKELYFDFQRFLIEDSPAIFLYHPVWYNIHRK